MSINHTRRKTILSLGAMSLAGVGLPLAAARANPLTKWPEEPIRVVVGYSPGGTTDAVARCIAEGLSARLGPVVVENKPGAAAMIGVEHAYRGRPGYTFLSANWGEMVTVPHIYDGRMKIEPIRDMEPLAVTYFADMIATVNPKYLDVHTLQELVDVAKSRKEPIRMGTAGNGSGTHMVGELFQATTGVEFMTIPYKGSGPAMTDLLGGHIDLIFDSVTSAAPHVRAGTLRGLAVTSSEREPQIPDLPTFVEAGFADASATGWGAFFTQKSTPQEIKDRMTEELRIALADPKTQERMRGAGSRPTFLAGDEMRTFMQGEYERWKKVVSERGIKPA